ncbi:hypothetical protein TNCV_2407601 [Trichonephila clavipes]|nr:hypothetical protein TNCV_2407601 [Trichonephila clavipes]
MAECRISACIRDSSWWISSFNSGRLDGRDLNSLKIEYPHSQKSTGVRSGNRGGHVNLQRLLIILRLSRPDLTRSTSNPVSSNR